MRVSMLFGAGLVASAAALGLIGLGLGPPAGWVAFYLAYVAVATSLDAVIAAPAAILGLAGLWLGFARSSVAWPMRWAMPLLGAYAAGRISELCVAIVWEVIGLRYIMGPPVGWVAFVVGFVAALVPLLMFMDNLIARVTAWTSGRRTGPGERVLGALFGIACGLLVAAAAIEHSPLRRQAADEADWVRASVMLPYFRGASEAMERALSLAWPYAIGAARHRW